MVQSVLIHMQNPEREDLKKTKEKEKEKKEAKPKGHDSGALQRPRKWIDCILKAFWSLPLKAGFLASIKLKKEAISC